MARRRGRDLHRLVLQVDRDRRCASATSSPSGTSSSRILALKQDAGSGALEQMVLAEFCSKHFADHVPKLNKAAGQQAAGAARGAGRAVRHRRRVRRPAGRHLSLDQAARQRRHGEARPGGAGGRRVAQSRPGMVDQQGPMRAAGCGSASPIPSPRPSSRASRCWPRSAAASSACRCAAPTSTSARRPLMPSGYRRSRSTAARRPIAVPSLVPARSPRSSATP